MQDDLEVLKAELAEAKKANEKMKEEAEKDMKAKCEIENTIADLQMQLLQAQEALAAEKTDKQKMFEEMIKMKKEKQMSKRKADLAEAGLDETEVQETSIQFESLADDMFETVVAALKKAKMTVKQSPTEIKEGEKPSGPEGDKVKKNTKADVEIDSNETEAEVLETAEANQTDIPMAETAEEESIRSFASDWFSNNVLKTTASIK